MYGNMFRFRQISKNEPTVLALILILTTNITSSTPACQNLKNDTKLYGFSMNGQEMVEHFFELVPCTNHTITLTDIPSTVHFVVVQTHAYLYNVTLGYSSFGKIGQNIVGTNIGLVQITDGASKASFNLENQHVFSVSVLLAFLSYGHSAPIPGGCNMEFEIETSPFMKINVTSDTIQVDAQPAQNPDGWISNVYGGPCTPNTLNYETYQLYLPQNDFTMKSYFNGIRKMLSVKRIKQNGRKIVDPSDGSKLRRLYSKYYGIGSVHAIIVSAGNLEYSAYVPIHTYACNPEYNFGTCYSQSVYLLLSCFLLGCGGVFLCFFGNKYSSYEMVVMFGLFVALIVFILLMKYNNIGFSTEGCVTLSIIFGLIVSRIFLSITQKCDIGIIGIACLIDNLMLGILLTAAVFYTPISDLPTFDDKTQYWLSFAMSVLIILLLAINFHMIIIGFAPAIVGAFVIVLSLELFVHSNLRYIIINPVRQAYVENFEKAAISPPYQMVDLIIITIFFVLSVIGIYVQPKKCFPQSPDTTPLHNNGTAVPKIVQSQYGTCSTPDSNNESVFLSDN